MSYEVEVQRVSTSGEVPDAQQFQAWASLVLRHHCRSGALSVRIVDEHEGAQLNEAFRKRRGATNVLSFPFDAAQWTDPPLLGDIVICAQVVNAEARAQRKHAHAHYAHMTVHGVLHLLGFDHVEQQQAALMERIECEHLLALGFANPYDSTLPTEMVDE